MLKLQIGVGSWRASRNITGVRSKRVASGTSSLTRAVASKPHFTRGFTAGGRIAGAGRSAARAGARLRGSRFATGHRAMPAGECRLGLQPIQIESPIIQAGRRPEGAPKIWRSWCRPRNGVSHSGQGWHKLAGPPIASFPARGPQTIAGHPLRGERRDAALPR